MRRDQTTEKGGITMVLELMDLIARSDPEVGAGCDEVHDIVDQFPCRHLSKCYALA